MENVQKVASARQITPAIEWQICEDERDWETAQSAEGMHRDTPLKDRQERRHWRLSVASLFLLFLVLAAAGAWRRAHAGLATVTSELEAEVVAELWRGEVPARLAIGGAASVSHDISLPYDPGEIVTQVAVRDLGQDWAMVDVVFQQTADGRSYRQTRVYGEGPRGWVRVEPTASRWVRNRRFESAHFVFAYHGVDDDAVRLAAPQLDELYVVLNGLFAQAQPTSRKLVIAVDPMRLPNRDTAQQDTQTEIVIASPAALLLPSDLAASDVLVQSLSLALYNRLYQLPGQGLRLQSGLRLWFMWDQQLPLAQWRLPLVQWLFGTPPARYTRDVYDRPAFADDLCAHHKIWMSSPLEIHVPVLCGQSSTGQGLSSDWRDRDTITHSSLGSLLYGELISPEDFGLGHNLSLPAPGPHAVVLATLFEYVTAQYGRAQIPRLLAAIPDYDRVETLIPAVFTVPLVDFEQGWRTFLAEQYALDP